MIIDYKSKKYIAACRICNNYRKKLNANRKICKSIGFISWYEQLKSEIRKQSKQCKQGTQSREVIIFESLKPWIILGGINTNNKMYAKTIKHCKQCKKY